MQYQQHLLLPLVLSSHVIFKSRQHEVQTDVFFGWIETGRLHEYGDMVPFLLKALHVILTQKTAETPCQTVLSGGDLWSYRPSSLGSRLGLWIRILLYFLDVVSKGKFDMLFNSTINSSQVGETQENLKSYTPES